MQASLEKVFIRIVSGEGGEHEARDAHNRSVQVAQDLGDDSDDDLDNFQFRERTCCKCSYFAHGLLCKYHSTCCCAMCCYMFMSILSVVVRLVQYLYPYLSLVPHVRGRHELCGGVCCLQEPKVDDQAALGVLSSVICASSSFASCLLNIAPLYTLFVTRLHKTGYSLVSYARRSQASRTKMIFTMINFTDQHLLLLGIVQPSQSGLDHTDGRVPDAPHAGAYLVFFRSLTIVIFVGSGAISCLGAA